MAPTVCSVRHTSALGGRARTSRQARACFRPPGRRRWAQQLSGSGSAASGHPSVAPSSRWLRGAIVRTTSSREGTVRPVARLKALAWRDGDQRLVSAESPFGLQAERTRSALRARRDGLRLDRLGLAQRTSNDSATGVWSTTRPVTAVSCSSGPNCFSLAIARCPGAEGHRSQADAVRRLGLMFWFKRNRLSGS
jgi:hypothetical protein